MPGIYPMAALTIIATVILCITALNYLTHTDSRYYWLVLAGLPLSPIVNRFIKTPFITGLAELADTPLRLSLDTPIWFMVAIWLNAPLFEEAIKAMPMRLSGARVFLQDASHALWAGLALGFGFGLGEAAYLAYGIAQSAAYDQLPWYVFTGYASERMIVTFGHGLMTSLAVLGIQRGGKHALFGYLSAVGLHALINLGPILLALKLIPAAVASMTSYAAILAAFIIFQKNSRTAAQAGGIESQEIIYYER